jgi:hypothetical protein
VPRNRLGTRKAPQASRHKKRTTCVRVTPPITLRSAGRISSGAQWQLVGSADRRSTHNAGARGSARWDASRDSGVVGHAGSTRELPILARDETIYVPETTTAEVEPGSPYANIDCRERCTGVVPECEPVLIQSQGTEAR